jgi:hypothetical protein
MGTDTSVCTSCRCRGGVLNSVTVCPVGSELWRGSLSGRTLIAENRCAALFVSTVSPETRIGTAACASVGACYRFTRPDTWPKAPPSRASSIPVFVEPCLVLRTSRNDDDVARAADPLFAAEAELHLALEHPNDLLICVTVRLDMDPGPDTPPYDHPLVARENATADLFADLLTRFPQRNWQVLGQI